MNSKFNLPHFRQFLSSRYTNSLNFKKLDNRVDLDWYFDRVADKLAVDTRKGLFTDLRFLNDNGAKKLVATVNPDKFRGLNNATDVVFQTAGSGGNWTLLLTSVNR